MKKKILRLLLLCFIIALLGCSENTGGAVTDNTSGVRPTDLSCEVDGGYVISASRDESTGIIKGEISKCDLTFTIEDNDHLFASKGTDVFIPYIEELLDITIEKYTFDDGRPYAFSVPTSIKEFHFFGDTAFFREYVSVDGIVYTKDMREIVLFPPGIEGEYTVSDSIIRIRKDAFKFSKLTKVTLPDTVHIEDEAFDNGEGIEIEISFAPVTIKREGLVLNAEEKQDGTMRGTITNESAGEDVLYSEEFYIDKGHLYGDMPYEFVHELRYYYKYSDIHSVTFSTDKFLLAVDRRDCTVMNYYIKEPIDYVSVDGVIFTKDMKTLVLFPAGRDGEFTVPDGIERISAGAFRYSKLTKVRVSRSVVVDGGAFVGASNIVIEYIDAPDENDNVISATVAGGYTLTLEKNEKNGIVSGNIKELPISFVIYDNDHMSSCDEGVEKYISDVEALLGITIVKFTFEIEPFAFSVPTNLLDLNSEGLKYTGIDGVVYSYEDYRLMAFPAGREGEFTVPVFVSRISAGAFRFSKLTKVRVSRSVVIEDGAFDTDSDIVIEYID